MIIFLKDHDNDFIKECLTSFSRFSEYYPFLDEAIDHLKSLNLRHNTTTGKTSDNELGCIASYTYKQDIPTDYCDADYVTWELGGCILNSAGRLKRGLSA